MDAVRFNQRRAGARRQLRRAGVFEHHLNMGRGTTLILRARVPLVKARRMNYNLTLKGHVENFTLVPGRDLIEKVMLHIRRSVSSTRIYKGIFIVLACLYQKLLVKNCWCPSMTLNNLGVVKWGHWSQLADSGCQAYLVTCKL